MPASVKAFNEDAEVVERLKEQFYENIDVPSQLILTEDLNTHYDCSNTLAALADSDIHVPPLKNYAATLWNYWDLHLHPRHSKPRYLEDAVAGKHVLITGGSEGIGKQAAEDFAKAGATVVVVARSQEKLDSAVAEIKSLGGKAHSYTCDLTDLNACDDLIDKVLDDLGHIDILVNNAGRSIRRSLNLTYDRFHDFERVMQLNYFTAFTNIHMPLVRTSMIKATTAYKNVDVLTPIQAGELIAEAAMKRPVEVNTTTGELMRLLNLFAPDLYLLLMGTVYQMTEDSAAARGAKQQTVAERAMVALKGLGLDAKTLESVSNILKGYHS